MRSFGQFYLFAIYGAKAYFAKYKKQGAVGAAQVFYNQTMRSPIALLNY
jgi:hypothetical protein